MLVFRKAENLKPLAKTFSFTPQQTVVQEILNSFNSKVSVTFSDQCFSISSDNIVNFTHLPPAYILTQDDTKRTLLVFKKFEETSRKQKLLIQKVRTTKGEFAQRQPYSFEFPFNTTSGHLFYFLKQHFYSQQDLYEKLIFLKNFSSKEATKLWNFSQYIFPFTNVVTIFENIKTSAFASTYVSSPPEPAREEKDQVVIRYCFDPTQKTNLDSVVWRSNLLPSDKSISDILQRFKQHMSKDLFLTYHCFVVYNGSTNTTLQRPDLIDPSSQNHEIILFADKLCHTCLQTPAKLGNSLKCKDCKYFRCYYPDCQKKQEHSCTECKELFCREHSKWCNNNKCFETFCAICIRQPELVLCGHNFQQNNKGYNVDYKLWHQSEKLSPISSGHLYNVESVKHFLLQIPLLPQYQKYDYIVLDGKDKSKLYFTKDSKLFSTCIKELIHYHSKLRVQLKQGKHWCECSPEIQSHNNTEVCEECVYCGLEVLPKPQTCNLGSDGSFSVLIPDHSKVIFSGHAYYETSLFQVLQEFIESLLENCYKDFFKGYHSCTVKQGTKSFNICFNSPQIFKPIFFKRDLQTHATISFNEKSSCSCSKPRNIFELDSKVTSNCTQCGNSYHLFEKPAKSDLCSNCSTQKPNNIVGAYLSQLSKINQNSQNIHYIQYLGKLNKSINTCDNLRCVAKRRRVEIPSVLTALEFNKKLVPFMYNCNNLLIEGQMLLFRCHMCSDNLLNHIKLNCPIECPQCHFLYCLGCKSSESCSLCTGEFSIWPGVSKIETHIHEIKAFCKKAEKFSREFAKFSEPNFS
jgi:hypothetical protein